MDKAQYIKSTVERINRAADSSNGGPVQWCDDALATAVGILLGMVQKQQETIAELSAKVAELENPVKRVVMVKHANGRTEIAQDFAEQLEAERDLLATYDDASNRHGW